MSLQTYTGKVSAVSVAKPDKNKWGREYVKVAIMMDDNNWYSLFIDDRTDTDVADVVQAIQAGDDVTLDYEVTAKGFRNIKKAYYVGTQASSVASEDNKAPALATATERYNIKEQRITYSAAQKNATALITSLVASGNLSLGSKKADVLDNAVNYIGEVTEKLARKVWDFEFTEEQEEDDGANEASE